LLQQPPVQPDVPLIAIIPVYRDLVSGPRHRGEDHETTKNIINRPDVIDVIVARQQAQFPHADAGIDRQQGVEVAAVGVEDHRSRLRRGPAPPYRGPARVVGVIRLFGLLARGHIATVSRAACSFNRGPVGKIVVA
jgi:hypothetical protein